MVFKSRSGNSEALLQQSDQMALFSSAEELVAFSQGLFAADFRNPERIGCPVPGTVRGLVRSCKAPNNELRSHLFGCSECFNEYRNALLAFRAEGNVTANREMWIPFFVALSRKPVRAYASALALILLALTAAYVWRGYRLRQDQIVTHGKSEIIQQRENRADNNISVTTTSPTPVDKITRPERKQPTQEKALVAQTRVGRELIAMSIDLGNYAVTRGGAVSQGEIEFPRARLRLMLKLPEGSGPGLYTVSVIDASGQPSETRRVSSTDGKTLRATVNMQRLTPAKYWLRISHEGEPPVDVPIVVQPTRKP